MSTNVLTKIGGQTCALKAASLQVVILSFIMRTRADGEKCNAGAVCVCVCALCPCLMSQDELTTGFEHISLRQEELTDPRGHQFSML